MAAFLNRKNETGTRGMGAGFCISANWILDDDISLYQIGQRRNCRG